MTFSTQHKRKKNWQKYKCVYTFFFLSITVLNKYVNIVFPAFSLANWKSIHGISSGVTLKVPQVKQLLQDLGVSHLLSDDNKRCDWSKTPYNLVNSSGWADGMN